MAQAVNVRHAIRRCIAVLRARALCVQSRPLAILVLRHLLRRRNQAAAGRLLPFLLSPYSE